MNNKKENNWWDPNYKFNGGVCKVCGLKEYGNDTYNFRCEDCNQKIKERDSQKLIESKKWGDENPILHTIIITIGVAGVLTFIYLIILGPIISPWLDQGSATSNRQTEGLKTFDGYPCTDDCSGHKAGYNWAREKNITDPDDCGGRSQSFIEGCTSWAEKN